VNRPTGGGRVVHALNGSATPPGGHELRAEVEDFLYYEAALLDDWRLDEWLDLLTEDFHYTVPATDCAGGDGTNSLVLLDDNLSRARGRVNRLKSRRAHREFPWSRTRRLITNVRVLDVSGDDIEVTANFCVYRIRGDVNPYIGRYLYRLRRGTEGSLAISYRRAELDLEALRPHGTLSIIL
jgi:p-cumate 2,3-dioxygenase beta subunit